MTRRASRVRRTVDTSAPTHQNQGVRLTVNLEPDLYGLARSLAREEDCTISAAVNRLLRRSLPGGADRGKNPRRARTRNGFTVSPGRTVITAGTVRRADVEDER